MYTNASTPSATSRAITRVIALVALLATTGWATYSNITASEVAIDHGARPSIPFLGLLSAFGLIVVLVRYARIEAEDVDLVLLDGDVGPPVIRVAESGRFDVFLSYSRSQFYFAESLMLRLERNGVSAWFDTSRLRAGDDWRASIDRGLATCTSLVLVASRSALASPNVDYEWRSALRHGKKIDIVLFEAVRLPPELSDAAATITDMRTGFERKATKLATRLTTPDNDHHKARARNQFRFLPREPASVSLLKLTLILILAASLYFDYFNARTLVAIVTPHPKDIPDDSDLGFTSNILGVTFHGLPSKIYAFLGITVGTVALTVLAAYLLAALTYRWRFVLTVLPVTLFGSAWLYLDTSFINHSTSHIVVSINDRFEEMPANLNSSAWRDLGDALLGQYVDYGPPLVPLDYGSPFLSIGDAAPSLTTTSELWRVPTLLLLALATVAFLTARRSGALYRRLATGDASEDLRIRHNRRRDLPSGGRTHPSRAGEYPPRRGASRKKPPSWRLLHEPEDSQIAAEIETALTECLRAADDSLAPRDVTIVLLSNHTRQATLDSLEDGGPDLIYVVCTNIVLAEALNAHRRYQWFDYRKRSYRKLTLLAQSVLKGSDRRVSYSFPALPERLTTMVVPGPVRYKSHVIRLCATWLLAVTLFGRGQNYGRFLTDEGAGQLFPLLTRLMFWICIPCCLYFFWLGLELASTRTTYERFERRQRIVMIILFVTQLQFLLSFDDQLSIVLLGTLVNIFLAIAWFTPNAGHLQRWLPMNQRQPTQPVGTLAVPLWRQFARSSVVYLALFIFCYGSGVIFFADVAHNS